MNLKTQLLQIAENAKQASRKLAALKSQQKNQILLAMAESLLAHEKTILEANSKDVEKAKRSNISPPLLDRLQLSSQRILAMAEGMRRVSQLADPIGSLLEEKILVSGLILKKMRVPIGVIAIIYESRPNVTADVSSLCLKTANAVILRGGSDAFYSNQAISSALSLGGEKAGLPLHAIQMMATTEHEAVNILVSLEGKIDLVIPRGGEKLIQQVVDHAKVPIIKHYKGICHIYVDVYADQESALKIIENAKCQRPGVCNSVETVLIHEAIASQFLPQLVATLQRKQVEVRADEEARRIIPDLMLATEQDWFSEYLDLIVSIKIIPSIQTAIDHINYYGSHHSDAIISNDISAQQQFTNQVDSAVVYVNASTRFTDGEQFGMGAEIGISTDKLHARGPMGLEELSTYKYVVYGQGQIRE